MSRSRLGEALDPLPQNPSVCGRLILVDISIKVQYVQPVVGSKDLITDRQTEQINMARRSFDPSHPASQGS